MTESIVTGVVLCVIIGALTGIEITAVDYWIRIAAFGTLAFISVVLTIVVAVCMCVLIGANEDDPTPD